MLSRIVVEMFVFASLQNAGLQEIFDKAKDTGFAGGFGKLWIHLEYWLTAADRLDIYSTS